MSWHLKGWRGIRITQGSFRNSPQEHASVTLSTQIAIYVCLSSLKGWGHSICLWEIRQTCLTLSSIFIETMFQFGKYYLEDFTSWILFHLREPQTYRYYRGQDYVLIFIDADIVFLSTDADIVLHSDKELEERFRNLRRTFTAKGVIWMHLMWKGSGIWEGPLPSKESREFTRWGKVQEFEKDLYHQRSRMNVHNKNRPTRFFLDLPTLISSNVIIGKQYRRSSTISISTPIDWPTHWASTFPPIHETARSRRYVSIRRCDEPKGQLAEQENVSAFTHKRVALWWPGTPGKSDQQRARLLRDLATPLSRRSLIVLVTGPKDWVKTVHVSCRGDAVKWYLFFNLFLYKTSYGGDVLKAYLFF